MPNTLDTTVWQAPTAADPSLTTFISTGDIAAMWLRDSQNQVLPTPHWVEPGRSYSLLGRTGPELLSMATLTMAGGAVLNLVSPRSLRQVAP